MATLKDNKLLKKIKALDNFLLHLWIFIAVNVFLWLPWLIYGNTRFNSYLTYIGAVWGLILLIHYLVEYRKFRPNKE